MAGLDPAIHQNGTDIAGSSPAMTVRGGFGRPRDRKNGRSGEIRTHDPQHPMLMRYQAALRSDAPVLSIIATPAGARNAPAAGPVAGCRRLY